MNKIVRTPTWQISEPQIHEAEEIQTPQEAIKWIQEIVKGGSIDKVRIESKAKDIVPIYTQGQTTCTWAWVEYDRGGNTWTYGGMQKMQGKTKQTKEDA